MECFSHPGRRAVAICDNCRHGLCQACAIAASSGVCADCQRVRSSARAPMFTLTRLDQTCYRHSAPAVGLCSICGKPICRECATEVGGRSTCRECAPLAPTDAASPNERVPTNGAERPRVRGASAPAVRAPRPIGRRDVLGLIGIAWVGGLGAASLAVSRPAPVYSLECAQELRPWLEEAISHDPGLASRFAVQTSAARADAPSDHFWIGPIAGQSSLASDTVLASSPYVVAVWEEGRARLGLAADGPVDWSAVQRAIANGVARWIAPPTEDTPLGRDSLAILAAGFYGRSRMRHEAEESGGWLLPQDAAVTPDLREWLRPFYLGPRRSDERALSGDWVTKRNLLGDAGILPEHEAMAMIRNQQPPARLRVVYPDIGMARQFVLRPPDRDGAWTADRLRRALLSADAQSALLRHGLRPAVTVPGAPPDAPCVTLSASGVRCNLKIGELRRDSAYQRLVDQWRIR